MLLRNIILIYFILLIVNIRVVHPRIITTSKWQQTTHSLPHLDSADSEADLITGVTDISTESDLKQVDDNEKESYTYEANDITENSPTIQSTFENEQETKLFEKSLINKITDGDYFENPRGKIKVLPSYVNVLFSALGEDDQRARISTGGHTPDVIIRTYRGKYRRWEDGQRIVFENLNLVASSRIELVFVMKNFNDTNVDLAEQFTVFIDVKAEATQEEHKVFQFQEYLIFDISFVKSSLNVLTIRSYFQTQDSRVRILHSFEPLLVVYENLKDNPLLVQPGREKRDAGSHFKNINEQVSYDVLDDTFFACRRRPWTLQLDTFSWHWLLLPEHYDAGKCTGTCEFPLTDNLNSTSYSYIKNIWHEVTGHIDFNVPTAHCVPISYYPQSLWYLDRQGDVVFRQIAEMRVAYCGCI
ncbi:uncharacterized protein LOC128214898 [Mya arenaria]|uniref:uncharacterized protein LOC128214898 n=1 Tax=Mya arenaria TaxID=6604 RepID=UPI0022E1EFFB|nr:uncharacterized protein LOC128214898 [Mya arenaria]